MRCSTKSINNKTKYCVMFSIFYYTDVFQYTHTHTHTYTSNLGLNTMLKEYKLSEDRQKSTVSEECVWQLLLSLAFSSGWKYLFRWRWFFLAELCRDSVKCWWVSRGLSRRPLLPFSLTPTFTTWVPLWRHTETQDLFPRPSTQWRKNLHKRCFAVKYI